MEDYLILNVDGTTKPLRVESIDDVVAIIQKQTDSKKQTIHAIATRADVEIAKKGWNPKTKEWVYHFDVAEGTVLEYPQFKTVDEI